MLLNRHEKGQTVNIVARAFGICPSVPDILEPPTADSASLPFGTCELYFFHSIGAITNEVDGYDITNSLTHVIYYTCDITSVVAIVVHKIQHRIHIAVAVAVSTPIPIATSGSSA